MWSSIASTDNLNFVQEVFVTNNDVAKAVLLKKGSDQKESASKSQAKQFMVLLVINYVISGGILISLL
ncbi:hypothetical protein B5X24_HaOG207436 [Helicoverpa armigera]|nr:hypothetical protein B5X24_HaOG207436 [Helicoverpa armigera]